MPLALNNINVDQELIDISQVFSSEKALGKPFKSFVSDNLLSWIVTKVVQIRIYRDKTSDQSLEAPSFGSAEAMEKSSLYPFIPSELAQTTHSRHFDFVTFERCKYVFALRR